jgi:hypothetical protein
MLNIELEERKLTLLERQVKLPICIYFLSVTINVFLQSLYYENIYTKSCFTQTSLKNQSFLLYF